MPSNPILLALCGEPPSAIARDHGSYVDWFVQGLGDRVELTTWDARTMSPQPPLSQFAGVVITGSAASLTEPEPWMEVCVETIREAAETSVPLLGICFGHQLVGCAYGAPTVKAPEGGEEGSLPLTLNSAGIKDPLFKDTPETFLAQFSHYDQVDPDAIAYSNGLRVLASTGNTAVQALAGGDFIRTVQYHPEFSREIMASYLQAKDIDPGKALACPESTKIFENWLEGWIFNR